ncbi:hypothetical protein BJ165DRAFT_152634 [Panaeolus papilionaceus]|nr:hypothetical protein BJ165DRAFT_152634 [Panaeolus papilionaceus]
MRYYALCLSGSPFVTTAFLPTLLRRGCPRCTSFNSSIIILGTFYANHAPRIYICSTILFITNSMVSLNLLCNVRRVAYCAHYAAFGLLLARSGAIVHLRFNL